MPRARNTRACYAVVFIAALGCGKVMTKLEPDAEPDAAATVDSSNSCTAGALRCVGNTLARCDAAGVPQA